MLRAEMTPQDTFYFFILLLGFATYISAVWQMMRGEYSPSFFSRGVWFFLGANSFATVLLGDGSESAVLLAGTAFVGTGAVFAFSYKKGSRDFGLAEKISLLLLVVSLFLWAVLNAPFIGLIMTLVAHFIGGIPTVWRTIKKASTEQAYHWYFFFIASVLSVISSPNKSLTAILFPLYFVFFDGMMLLLVNRKLLRKA